MCACVFGDNAWTLRRVVRGAWPALWLLCALGVARPLAFPATHQHVGNEESRLTIMPMPSGRVVCRSATKRDSSGYTPCILGYASRSWLFESGTYCNLMPRALSRRTVTGCRPMGWGLAAAAAFHAFRMLNCGAACSCVPSCLFLVEMEDATWRDKTRQDECCSLPCGARRCSAVPWPGLPCSVLANTRRCRRPMSPVDAEDRSR